MDETTEPTVTIEVDAQGYDAYVIKGEKYYIRDTDTPEDFLKQSRNFALLAEYLESPEQKEHRRLKARRAQIAQRYGISGWQEPARAMIEDILKLEEAAK